MSTRRQSELRFDHGAQYFTVRDPRFCRTVDSWQAEGLAARWPGNLAVLQNGKVVPEHDATERWVGVPGMNAICRHLAAGLDVSYETRVDHLEFGDDRWTLSTESGEGLGHFEAVVVSAPAPQTAALLEASAPELAAHAAKVEMAPCWAVMVSYPHTLGLNFDGAFVKGAPLAWIARNSAKPGRPAAEAWVLHASPEWSRENLELDREIAAQRLVDVFHDIVSSDPCPPTVLTAHRWRFALPVNPLAESCLFDSERGLAACGDWAGGPRVEGAFLSGQAAAERLQGMVSAAAPL